MAEAASDEDEIAEATSNMAEQCDDILFEIYADYLPKLRQKNRSRVAKIMSESFILMKMNKLTSWIIQEEEKNVGTGLCKAGRLGPHCVEFSNSKSIGTFSFYGNPQEMKSLSSFSTGCANTCVFKGKWQYEVTLCSKGVMQIGWATSKCTFSQVKGVGDTLDSYAYDGNRQRRWNIATYQYGEVWMSGDVISCTIDLDEGKMTYFRNGRSLGEAFDNVRSGPGMAYFPAISMAINESLIVNCGTVPFHYPQVGYMPLVIPDDRAILHAKVHLRLFEKLVDAFHLSSETLHKQSRHRPSSTSLGLQVIGQNIGRYLSVYLCHKYIVHKLFLPYLISIMPFHTGESPPSNVKRKVHLVFDLLLTMLEEDEIRSFLKALINSLENLKRIAPQDLDFRDQIHSLQILQVILSHQRTRECCMNDVLFENVTFSQFMEIGSVDLSILKEKFTICYWSDKKGNSKYGTEDSYRLAVSTIKESVNKLEDLQVAILELMLSVDAEEFCKTSRFNFFTKLRLFLNNQTAVNRRSSVTLIPLLILMNLCDRLFEVLRRLWRREIGGELTITPLMFYDGTLNYPNVQRIGGLYHTLKNVLPVDKVERKKNEYLNNAISSDSLPHTYSIDKPSTSSGCTNHMLKVESRRTLEHLFDCVVMMRYAGGHKCFSRSVTQTELFYSDVDLFNQLNEKYEKLPPDSSPAVRAELEISISVITNTLNDHVHQHVWNNVRIINEDCFQIQLDLLSVVIKLLEKATGDGKLFLFIPFCYFEIVAVLFQNIKRLIADADPDADGMDPPFLGGVPMKHNQWIDCQNVLGEVAMFLTSHFCDERIVDSESRESVMQMVASFVSSKLGLRAFEHQPEETRVDFIMNTLEPYERYSWAEKNWIMVQFWKGRGFGFRFNQSPHLASKLGPSPAYAVIRNTLPTTVPCSSDIFLRHISNYLLKQTDEVTEFINTLLNQLNWAFTEFLAMLQQIQIVSQKNLRTPIDHRQLRVCCTCYDLTLALARVLEMVVGVASEVFLDASLATSKSLLCRLCQLVSQILSRSTCSSSCFGFVVDLNLMGLDDIDHYPLMTAVTGIVISLFKNDMQNGASSNRAPIDALMREACFKVSVLTSLLGVEPPTASKPLELYSIPKPELPKQHKDTSFSFMQYPEHITREELQLLVDLINYLQKATQEGKEHEMDDNEDELCPICYANLPNAVFYPCKHTSCVSCIAHYLLNGLECFYCKARIDHVINKDTGIPISTPAPFRYGHSRMVFEF